MELALSLGEQSPAFRRSIEGLLCRVASQIRAKEKKDHYHRQCAAEEDAEEKSVQICAPGQSCRVRSGSQPERIRKNKAFSPAAWARHDLPGRSPNAPQNPAAQARHFVMNHGFG